MGFHDVNDPVAVKQAIEEFQTFDNASDFLELYGFGPASSYLLLYDGKYYSPKAILGVAHKYQFPLEGALKSSEFSGGENFANKVLINMGFEIIDASNKIKFFSAVKGMSRGSIAGGGKAPHKPLLLLLAVRDLGNDGDGKQQIQFWVDQLKPLLEESGFFSDEAVFRPLWHLEKELWSLEHNGVEIRPSPLGEPDIPALKSGTVLAGLSPLGIEVLRDRASRAELVELLIDDLLTDITPSFKDTLRILFHQRDYWWVNQGTTYEEARDLGHVWAPLVQKNGIPASHHSVLKDMKIGDVVIHYARGFIRALGEVQSEAVITSRPLKHSEKDWSDDGRQTGIKYFELERPIPLEEIQNIPVGYGPFNRNAGINQGYMYSISHEWSDLLRSQFSARWPYESPWGMGSNSLTTSNKSVNLAYWLNAFRQVSDFESLEINYKKITSEKVKQAFDLLEMDDTLWIDKLRSAISKSNIVNYRVLSGFVEQCELDPPQARLIIMNLLDETGSRSQRIDDFAVWDTRNSGNGTKLSIISQLLSASQVNFYPVFNQTPVTVIHQLIGRRSLKGLASERYEEFIRTIDNFLKICAETLQEGERRIDNRLEMQSAMWMVSKGIPHASWPPIMKAKFVKFIEGKTMNSDLEELAEELFLQPSFLVEIEELLEDKKQVIFYGPPGAGKTYVAMKLARHLTGDNENESAVEIIQFHPSYSYEDFVEGFRPASNGNFDLRKGKLLSIAERAHEEPSKKFFLIIDEINRGNLAKIFGEMYFLLEYRDHTIQLQYSGQPFKMPPNLYFIGTMNSADRSIGLIDSALRRRFHFVSFYPTEVEMKNLLRDWLVANVPNLEWVADLVDKTNLEINNPDFAIGPSHFMKKNLSEELVRKIWRRSIIPYLEDVFFSRREEVARFEFDRMRTLRRLHDGQSRLSEPADVSTQAS